MEPQINFTDSLSPMLLLVIDTSGKDGFVGLVRAGDQQDQAVIELIDEIALAGGTFSAQMVPQISGLLEKQSLQKGSVDGFVVVSGPGSFTGLRVGLAAVKALAEIMHKPIVPVSLLEVLAPSSLMIAVSEDEFGRRVHRYAVALDAGRGEAYVGEYEVNGQQESSIKSVGVSLLKVEDLSDLLTSGTARWIATPDQTVFDALSKKVPESQKHFIRRSLRRPRSLEVAVCGWQKLKAGETVSPEQLDANYIRRSDAEIFSKPAAGS